MLSELHALLGAIAATATASDYRRLVVDENVLGKRTASNRAKAHRHLKALYGLDPTLPVFRVLRSLWELDRESGPLLALACAIARDPLLRASIAVILDASFGEEVDLDRFQRVLQNVATSYSAKTIHSLTQNLASSWTQSGHLEGKIRKRRARARATPAAAVYAMTLGFLEGVRGPRLLETTWARLLDRSPQEVLALVQLGGRSGWIDLRTGGDVIDIRPRGLLSQAEMELTNDGGS